jgi:copper chaperone CopZ
MDKLSLTIPTLYGDHHTVAIKQILEGLKGVKDIYVSSAFNLVTLSFDEKTLSPEQIETILTEQGYSPELPETAHVVGAGERINRHTAAITGVGDTLSFAQAASPFEGRALWPCPGFSIQIPTEDA